MLTVNGASDEITAMTLFAHPDDAELSCFGLLAKLREAGHRIVVAIVTRGENGLHRGGPCRIDEARAAAALIGAEIVIGDFPDGHVQRSTDLVHWVEGLLDEYRPSLIVTHFNGHSPTSHQDHVAVESAVQIAVRRAPWRPTLLLAEGIDNNPAFQPNWFVDITEHYQKKLHAISMHQSQAAKYYMQKDHLEIRSRKWALNFRSPSDQPPVRSYWEAFYLAQHAV